MGNKRWTRLIALTLAVVCTLTVAAAISFDQNGDGKITVWDLQKLISNKDYDAAVNQILGGGDEQNPNADGAYEIWTELGLQNLRKNAAKGYTFKLMADIDLGGKDWTPIADFMGTFDGNDHTISNFQITKCNLTFMGFFANNKNASADNRTVIRDLHMTGVELIVDDGDTIHNDNVQYAGPIIGSITGDLVDCTAECVVTDLRTTLPRTMYYGALAGRNPNQNGKSMGIMDCKSELNVDVNIVDGSDFTDTTRKVAAKMATNFAELSDSKYSRKTGLAGFSQVEGYASTAVYWQDLTNSTKLAPQQLQERRKIVVDEFYEMCTVEWTSANRMISYKYVPYTETMPKRVVAYDHAANVTYLGLPYINGASTSMDCFNAYVDQFTAAAPELNNTYENYYFNADNSGVSNYINILNNYKYPEYVQYMQDPEANAEALAVLLKEWPQVKLMTGNVSAGGVAGFGRYLGADCSALVTHAWRKVSATDTTGGRVYVQGVAQMIPSYGKQGTSPTSDNIGVWGVVPVNGLILPYADDRDGNGTAYETADKLLMISDFYLENKEAVWESMAMVTQGDILNHFALEGAHVRMAMSDAVVIRKYNGKVNTELSYIVTAEEGGSGVDSDGVNHYSGTFADGRVWKSDCCVDRRMTFADLSENTLSEVATERYGKDVYGCWIPSSCRVLKEVDTKAATAWCKKNSENAITSNFHIISTTVDGNTAYTGIGHSYSGQRDRVIELTVEQLTELHGDITGKTVTVKLANDQIYNFQY